MEAVLVHIAEQVAGTAVEQTEAAAKVPDILPAEAAVEQADNIAAAPVEHY